MFLSTLPARGATSSSLGSACSVANFYPRSPRGERPGLLCFIRERNHFYPRSPRGERPWTSSRQYANREFLSTLPARGATAVRNAERPGQHHFYPRSPRGERPSSRRPGARWPDFYPRSPRGERQTPGTVQRMDSDFYPRSPRGERQSQYQSQIDQLIFLSTLPARGATGGIVNIAARDSFLSTLPARGATCYIPDGKQCIRISIHAPREGSDKAGRTRAPLLIYFYPRSPRGERRMTTATIQHSSYFYPRSPRGERRFSAGGKG